MTHADLHWNIGITSFLVSRVTVARMKKVSNDANTITHVERAVLHGINFSMNIKNKKKSGKI